MAVFELTRSFPKEETYSLTDQVRLSSRSVAANIAEAWRKRRYPAAFVAKLSDADGEAAETETWIELAVKCGYLTRDAGVDLFNSYEEILSMLAAMQHRPDKWLLTRKK